MIGKIIGDSTSAQDDLSRFFFLGESSEFELDRICALIQKKTSEKISILLEPVSEREDNFVKSIIQELNHSFKVFDILPKAEIKDLLSKENKNSLISCYKNGENIILNIENFNSKECERVLDLILKVITKEEINLSEFDSNNNSVIKKNNNFSLVLVQKNSFNKLKPPCSNIYCHFSNLFQRLGLFPFETLSNWIKCLESSNQEEELLGILKKKKIELEEEILKRRIGKIFRNKTTDFGDKNFTEKKEENTKDSQNLYKIFPTFHLYFDISKKESIEFLKNGGLENLKKQISKIIPNEDFQITNLRIGSIDLELTYTSQQVKDYLKNVITGGDTKKFENDFKALAEEFSKKTFEVFNKKDLKASVQAFYLDKSKKEKVKQEVKQCLQKGNKCGLRQTIDNLEKEIIKEVLERETNIKKNVSNIEKAINNMISFNKYNQKFKEELEEAKKDSIFEYVVDSLPIIFKDSQQYENKKAQCPNCQTKILFHGTKSEIVPEIITDQFLCFDGYIGEGVYFSDMLDLIRHYCSRSALDCKRTLKPGESFYVVGSEIFFDKTKAVRIDKYIQGQKKKTEKNGIHYGISESFGGDVIPDSKVASFKNKCVGREYMISFVEQINPIYGIKLKRNEYCIIWRDPNFKYNNEFREYIENLKKFIEEEVGCNLYIETSTERALWLVNKKKYNKIILVSNIGLDLGGKHFVEEARKIIGCKAYTLFSSYLADHLNEGWLKDFENALFSNKREFSEEFLKNFSINGLRNLKKKIESYYNCKIKDFTEVDYIHYTERIYGLNFEGFELYKHKFLPNPC